MRDVPSSEPDMRPLAWLWLCFLTVGGLVAFGLGWSRLPPAREALTLVQARGPISVRLELISERSGRYGSSNYRTQHIGAGPYTVSPPRTLWVDDIEYVRPGQNVRFLIDPARSLVYEATSEGKTLLSYEASARNRRGGGWGGMLLGLALLAAGATGLVKRWLWLRANG